MKARHKTIIGVLLLALAVGTIHFGVGLMKARVQSQTHACSGNLRIMDSMKEQWAMATRVTNGPVDSVGVLKYIKGYRLPTCPGDGTYTLGAVGELPECNIHRTVTNRHYPNWWE